MVAEWLAENGLDSYSDLLCTQHKIDGHALLTLSEDDLKQPPIKMTVLGDIKRIMSKVHQLRANDPDFVDSVMNNGIEVMKMIQKSQNFQSPTTRRDNSTMCSPYHNNRSQRPVYEMRVSQERESRSFDTELWKTFLSFVYVFTVFLLTAFVMVIVHDRVPDMQKYPPLPDIFLDNMPYVPWAFEACEVVGLTLCILWFGVLLFHKHR